MEGSHYNLIRQTNDVPRRRQKAKTVPFMPVCFIYIFETPANSHRARVDPRMQLFSVSRSDQVTELPDHFWIWLKAAGLVQQSSIQPADIAATPPTRTQHYLFGRTAASK